MTWQPSAKSWAVHYKSDGKTHIQRVRVKGSDLSKKLLFGAKQAQPDETEMASLRERAFREACLLWNELDTTNRPRIDLGDSSAP